MTPRHAPLCVRVRGSSRMLLAGWVPPYAPDAAELLLVLITLLISLGIMVAFGAWWSR
jgi:hypothetical protein